MSFVLVVNNEVFVRGNLLCYVKVNLEKSVCTLENNGDSSNSFATL